MSDGQTDWHWEARAPATSGCNGVDVSLAPRWVKEVWELRGLVLYDGGQRPQFLGSDGRFADRDPLDLLAYHVLGRCGEKLVGCIRFLPVSAPLPGLTEKLLGCDRFERLLESLDASRGTTVDVGRWVVHPHYRGFRVALSLVGACWSFVQSLGFETAVATVGTRSRQDVILHRTGMIPAPGMGTYPCDTFQDELRTMYAVVRTPASNFRGVVRAMQQQLVAAPSHDEPRLSSRSA